ncbi:MAG: hypothetical protein U0105_09380 [Candidatus Obscuribacterales bacterium]
MKRSRSLFIALLLAACAGASCFLTAFTKDEPASVKPAEVATKPLWKAVVQEVALPGATTDPEAKGSPSRNRAKAIRLNNEGVIALNSGQYQLALQKFQEGLDADRTYGLVRTNLAIAHNNLGLQMQKTPIEASIQMRESLFYAPQNATTQGNYNTILQMCGINPKSFNQRVELGDIAFQERNYHAAFADYLAAAEIKDDPTLHEKLIATFRKLTPEDKQFASNSLHAICTEEEINRN